MAILTNAAPHFDASQFSAIEDSEMNIYISSM